MKADSTVRPVRGKSPSEVDQLKSELVRLDRERKKLTEKIVKKAAAAERQEKAGRSKKRRSKKPKKRQWKDGRPPLPYPDFPLKGPAPRRHVSAEAVRQDHAVEATQVGDAERLPHAERVGGSYLREPTGNRLKYGENKLY